MELRGRCRECMGCNRLEDPNFEGVYRCEYATSKQLSWKDLREEILKNESR